MFAYSKRDGTPAARRPGQVPEPVKSARSKAMIAATNETRIAFLDRMVGRVEKVLIETTQTPLGFEGCTANYTPVIVNCGPEFCGRIVPVKILSRAGDKCVGQMLDPDEL